MPSVSSASQSVRVAAIQMQSGGDVAANLKAAQELVAEAASRGAVFAALPEMFAEMRREGESHSAKQALDGEIPRAVQDMARSNGLWLLGGSFAELAPAAETAQGRAYNTSVLADPHGEIRAVYRKMHLFDVDLQARGGGVFRESDTIAPGEAPVVAQTPFGGVGLSICYDLRFPELYRRMGELSAAGEPGAALRFLAAPSAFAPQTGRDHWEVLLRARAIENQCFVVAPAQWGRHSPKRASHGRAAIVDAWGTVLAMAPDHPCAVLADCDLAQQDRIRAAFPVLQHRRL